MASQSLMEILTQNFWDMILRPYPLHQSYQHVGATINCLEQWTSWVSYGGNGHDPYRSILLVKPISQPIVRKGFSIPHGLKAMVKVPQEP